ncbi:MAG TPA: ABC transporter permease [Pseudomonadales bacterium]|jgi:molybdate/tungstate transport system permease protein|nr:ABC transporter permease [Pseudomonadales bacterium]|tara:strand:- start:12 stop:821 length:810 start_codon:yes stop_codon:yes gene_type:complete
MTPILTPKMRIEPLYLLFSFFGGLVLLFIIAPLLGMVLQTSFSDLTETAIDAEVQKSIWLTLWTSMAATLILGTLSVPFAYLLARKNFPFKRLVVAFVDIPIVIPHSAAGIAILGVVSRNTPIGSAAESMGFHFVGGAAGIMIAMAFVSIPFLINAARNGFSAVPERLEKAALSLGASPARVFFFISVPLAWRAILSGFVLMWARGLSEFGAVIVVAYHPIVTPVLIYERFGAFGLQSARPIAILFIAVCLVFFIVIRLLAKEPGDVVR